MTAPVAVWINESAGSGKAGQVGRAAVAALLTTGVTIETVIESDPAHATTRVRDVLAQGARALVVVGGDGTVHHALQVVAGTETPLGIVPAGSGDDIARAAGMVQSDSVRALAQISVALGADLAHLPRMDLGRAVTGSASDGTDAMRWFGATLYAGFDARVNARANAMNWPPGRARYPIAMLAELSSFSPAPFLVSIDEADVVRQDACVAVVANGSSYGGGMQVVPHARVDDGLLDLMLLGGVSRTELLRVFPRVYRGTHGTHPAVTFHQGREITLDAPGLDAWADGEFVGPLPATVTAVPGALVLLRP